MHPHDISPDTPLSPDDPLAERLVAYVDGELAPGEARAFERLLTERPDLATEVALLRRTDALLASLPRESGAGDLADRVRALAATDAAPRGSLLRHPAFRLAAAACLVFAVALGARHALRDQVDAGRETAGVLSREEEQAIAQDLYLLRNLDALESADAEELRTLVDDLDLLDALALEEQEG